MVKRDKVEHTTDKAASDMRRKKRRKAFPLLNREREGNCFISISQQGGAPMSAEENKQVARRFITAFLAGDTAVLQELIGEDCVDHNPQPGQKPGRQGLIEILAGWRAAFPDLDATILHEVAEGEFVVQHGVGLGTNTGPLMGQPATGKQAQFAYMDMHRIVNGRIMEIWHLEDIAGLLYQLGLMPA